VYGLDPETKADFDKGVKWLLMAAGKDHVGALQELFGNHQRYKEAIASCPDAENLATKAAEHGVPARRHNRVILRVSFLSIEFMREVYITSSSRMTLRIPMKTM